MKSLPLLPLTIALATSGCLSDNNLLKRPDNPPDPIEELDTPIEPGDILDCPTTATSVLEKAEGLYPSNAENGSQTISKEAFLEIMNALRIAIIFGVIKWAEDEAAVDKELLEQGNPEALDVVSFTGVFRRNEGASHARHSISAAPGTHGSAENETETMANILFGTAENGFDVPILVCESFSNANTENSSSFNLVVFPEGRPNTDSFSADDNGAVALRMQHLGDEGIVRFLVNIPDELQTEPPIPSGQWQFSFEDDINSQSLLIELLSGRVITTIRDIVPAPINQGETNMLLRYVEGIEQAA